jgi:hypothetical protein
VTVSFPHENIYLPYEFDDYRGQFVQSPGRPDYLASLPVWSQETEKKFVVSLIQDLNSQLLQDLDTDPNFSRSKRVLLCTQRCALGVSKPPLLLAVPMQGSWRTAALH